MESKVLQKGFYPIILVGILFNEKNVIKGLVWGFWLLATLGNVISIQHILRVTEQ